jgi:hypothetical protein
VAMPNVTGKPVADAAKILAAQRLRLRVADRVYDGLPANAIVRQSPAPGEQIKVLQDAQVVLSLGPQAVIIPALEDQSVRLARIGLLQSGLQLGEVSSVYLPDSDPDIVMRQDPPGGTKATSPRVDLLVSLGPQTVSYVMPALVGMEQQEADRLLGGAKLRIAKHTPVPEPAATKGTVVSQNPPYGTRIDENTAIEIGIAD